MEFQTKKIKWIVDQDGAWLMVLHPDRQTAQDFILGLEDKPYSVKIKPHRKKRSLDSNSYYWVLAGKLSAKLRIPPAEIYRQHIQDIGDNYEVIPIKDEAVEKFSEAWGSNGVGWMVNILGPSKLPGYTNLMVYYGSSTYDSKQMGRLVDYMVEDCKEQGIETLTPTEVERMKGAWGNGK